jgi:hypothetical protein
MQQRQPRLGDILDDYCPRERRVTNHAVVAMVGAEVKQTRCTTCDADHEYKHAKVPRQRRKPEAPAALFAQAAAGAPKRVPHESEDPSNGREAEEPAPAPAETDETPPLSAAPASDTTDDAEAPEDGAPEEEEIEGPVHRPLIRATLPRAEGQPPPQRPAPEFTIRQPGGRQNRFRARQRGGQQFFGDRSGGNTGGGRPAGGRPPHHGQGQGPSSRQPRRHHGPHKRSK